MTRSQARRARRHRCALMLLCAATFAAAAPAAQAGDDASAPPPPPPQKQQQQQQQQPAECPRDLYLPTSSLLSRGARAFLEGTRPPPGGPAAARVPSADEARRQRARDAEGWRPQSERYRAAYVERDELLSLGGVATVRAEPKRGLAADGRPLAPPEGADGGGDGDGVDGSSALLFLHGAGRVAGVGGRAERVQENN
jgi:hypothetical protein